MAQYGWANCPDTARQQVSGFSVAVCQALGEDFIGIYLHGSLALGCFNPERSDLDFLAVTKERISRETRRELARVSLAYSARPHPIEWSLVREGVLRPWLYPTPYEFHYSEDWRERLTHEPPFADEPQSPTDPDLAAHVTMTRQRGLRLIGQSIEAVIPDVPRADYVDSLMRDVDFALKGITENPVYAILNLCRVCWYLAEGRVDSKDEGGVWALRYVPEAHKPLVQQALDVYRGTAASPDFSPASLARFSAFMGGELARLR